MYHQFLHNSNDYSLKLITSSIVLVLALRPTRNAVLKLGNKMNSLKFESNILVVHMNRQFNIESNNNPILYPQR